MNAIAMETLIHGVSYLHKLRNCFLGDGDVDGCQRLLLVEAPHAEFVDGQNTRDLGVNAGISLVLKGISENTLFRDRV